MITADQLNTLIAAIVALISVIIAILKNSQANTATATATTATQAVQALVPGTIQSQTPAIVATLPERSWKMSDSTKVWCTFDATPENKASILQQIDAAEAQHQTQYQVIFKGGYYNIEYGLLKGGAGNPSGK